MPLHVPTNARRQQGLSYWPGGEPFASVCLAVVPDKPGMVGTGVGPLSFAFLGFQMTRCLQSNGTPSPLFIPQCLTVDLCFLCCPRQPRHDCLPYKTRNEQQRLTSPAGFNARLCLAYRNAFEVIRPQKREQAEKGLYRHTKSFPSSRKQHLVAGGAASSTTRFGWVCGRSEYG